jgi:phenylpropionate dioxygenase-like ring-hydroxylating dioxygenase large terminal subunit
VLWNDASKVDVPGGTWNAIDEACPHRLASMSIGKVNADKGTISCRYHGWEFDATGKCTHIPNASSQSSAKNPRACSVGYPAEVRAGLLWVWPDDGCVTATVAVSIAVALLVFL